jgi:hypothetical protein
MEEKKEQTEVSEQEDVDVERFGDDDELPEAIDPGLYVTRLRG